MQNKKKLYMILGIVGIILLGVILYIGVTIFPKLQTGKEISDLLQPILTEENQSIHLDLKADFGGEPVILDSDIYMVKEEEIHYVVMEQMNFPIYVVGNILFLENGRAFKIAEEVETPKSDYKDLFVQIAAAYEAFDISCVKTDSEAVYSVTVTGEQVRELLAMAMPADGTQFDGIEKLQIQLVAQDGKLQRIEMTGKTDVNGTAVQVELTLSEFKKLEAGEYEIPEVVKNAVKTVDRTSLFNLSEDLYRLLVAFKQFQNEEHERGTVTLWADCGVIDFENTYKLNNFNNTESSSLDIEGIENLPAMIAVLCMEGEISCTEVPQGFEYKLSLDEISMEKITGMVVPELVNYVMHLTDGVVEVMLEDNHIASIGITIKGNVNILITEVPMEVGVEFQYK